jgi:HAD superfamily hydrolase (TIGR01490 family)
LTDVTKIETQAGAKTPAVAFFDLDGTLIIGQTQALLVRFFYSRKVIRLPFVLATMLWFVAYKLGMVKVTEKARKLGSQMLRGYSKDEMAQMMDTFTLDTLMPLAHERTIAALRRHQAQGDKVVVLSAALDPVVEGLCRHLEVEHHFGAPCEIVDGRYTGLLSGPTPYADHKAEVAADLMSRWQVDPADCWAYADHTTDITLLRSVGHPVAVNPRPGLLQAAEAEGWTIFP